MSTMRGSSRSERVGFGTALVAMAVLVGGMWLLEGIDQASSNALDAYGIRPRTGEGLVGVFVAPWLHGGWGHLLGNALFFWVFGNNIEDSLGHFRFLVFYLICGLAAAVAHIVAQPGSPLPTVGASGAISGILGAYLVLYPKVRVRMLFFFIIFFKVIPIPAWLVLIWWFFWQLVAALPELKNGADLTGGVAVWAHVGGFLTGVLLVKLFENRRLVVRRTRPA